MIIKLMKTTNKRTNDVRTFKLIAHAWVRVSKAEYNEIVSSADCHTCKQGSDNNNIKLYVDCVVTI